jgi:hypothetical protein
VSARILEHPPQAEPAAERGSAWAGQG